MTDMVKMDMEKELLVEGFVRVFLPDDRKELITLAQRLRGEGHSVTWGSVMTEGRITSEEAHHYRSCVVCGMEKGRRSKNALV